MTEDLDIFFTDFGVTITITDTFGVERDITALFFNNTEQIFQLDQINSDGPPVALAKTADTAGLTLEDKITVAGQEYNILAIEPDGTGFTRITLEDGYNAG